MMKLRKIVDNAFLTLHLKRQDSLTTERSENVYSSAFISSFVVCTCLQYFFDLVRNQS